MLSSAPQEGSDAREGRRRPGCAVCRTEQWIVYHFVYHHACQLRPGSDRRSFEPADL